MKIKIKASIFEHFYIRLAKILHLYATIFRNIFKELLEALKDINHFI